MSKDIIESNAKGVLSTQKVVREYRTTTQQNKGQMILFQTEDGQTKLEVQLQDETVWLSIDQMAELFQRNKSTISRHIKNVFEEGELDPDSTVAFFATVQKEGERQVERNVQYYNLDMIISLGYRIKSIIATQFRRWATERLKEYMIKGFTMDDERLKNLGGGNYWHELLDRIRDIRSSEKVMYRQVLDLYATSVDYNPQSAESIAFFKMVQNKLHYAAHGHTAAEVVFSRADATKPFMGLTTFKGALPILSEVSVAKNYLTEQELKVLNNLVSGYFDFAELRAVQHEHVYMQDYVQQLDAILTSTGQKLLEGPGSVSHAEAKSKAEIEYRLFQERTLSPVEVAYLETIRAAEKTAKDQLRLSQDKRK